METVEQKTLNLDTRKLLNVLINKQPTGISKFRETIRHLDKFLESNKKSIELLFAKAYVLCEMGRYSSALEYFDRCIQIYHDSQKDTEENITRIGRNALFYKGYVLKEMERFGDAKTNFEKYFKINGIENNQFYLYALANRVFVLKELGLFNDALDCYVKIENEICKKRCKPSEAKCYKKCPSDQEKNICIHSPVYEYLLYYKAYLHHKKGEHSDALGFIDESIEINKLENNGILLNEYTLNKRYDILDKMNGEALQWLVKHSREIESNEKEPIIEDDNTIDFLYEGNRLRLFGCNLSALRYFDQYIKTDSSNFYALYYKGCTLISTGSYKEALHYFNEALKISPNDIDVLFNMGNTCRRLGNYSKSIEYFNQSLMQNESDKDVLMYKGSVLNESNEYEEAIKCFEKINSYNKDKFEEEETKEYVLHSIGFAKMGQKKYAEAIKYFIDCLNQNEKNEYALLNLSYSLCRLNEYIDDLDKDTNKTLDYDKNKKNWKNEELNKNINLEYACQICKEELQYAEDLKAQNGNLYRHIQQERFDIFNKLVNSPDESVNATELECAKEYWNRREKRYRLAFAILNQYLELNNKNAESWFYKSVIHMKLLEYPEALESIEKYEKIYDENKHKYRLKDKSVELNREAVLNKIFLLGKLDKNDDLRNYIENKNNKDKIKDIDIIALLDMYSNLDSDDEISENHREIVKMLLDYNDFFDDAIKSVKKNEEFVKDCKDIYIQSLLIIRLLHVDNSDENYVAQYTTKFAVDNLLLKKSSFRLCSILSANDPEEGETLLKYLDIREDRSDLKFDYQSFIGCFSFNHNSLNQYRLYGKESDKEATGVCMVYKPDFFRDKIHTTVNTMYFKYTRTIVDKYALFRCIYIDPKTNNVVALGHRRSYTFYKTKKTGDTENREKVIKEKIDKYSEFYQTRLKSIQGNLTKLKDDIDEIVENRLFPEEAKGFKKEDILCKLLLSLRFLVKHCAYEEEQECRIYDIEKMTNNRNIKTTETGQMYVEYLAVPEFVKKIYFAPKAIEMELFNDHLLQEGLNHIKCQKSDLPFR